MGIFFKYYTRAHVHTRSGEVYGAHSSAGHASTLGPAGAILGRSFCGQDGPDGLHNSPMYVALAPKLNETGGGTGGADLRSLY